MIYHLAASLSTVVDIISKSISGYDTSVEYCMNYEISPNFSDAKLMPKTLSFLEYGQHHGTLYRLHEELEPLMGIVRFSYDFHAGKFQKHVFVHVTDLTRMKLILSTASSTSIQKTHNEFEICLFNTQQTDTGKTISRNVNQLLERMTLA